MHNIFDKAKEEEILCKLNHVTGPLSPAYSLLNMSALPSLASMEKEMSSQQVRQEIAFVSALDLLLISSQKAGEASFTVVGGGNERHHNNTDSYCVSDASSSVPDHPAINDLSFPFVLKPDQIKAVQAWVNNQYTGSIIYGSGTGKTEIAFECAKRRAELKKGIKSHSAKALNILLLVPRIVLVDQNYDRLVRYGISPEKIGRYFGEEKQINEITIATYHSALANLEVIRKAEMVIFDEVHLARGAFSKIFDAAKDDDSNGKKALLGLTATIDENDSRNASILTLLPPVRRYLIKDAVLDKRLARPIVHPIKVSLTEEEQELYDQYSTKIRNISRRFKRYDAKDMMALMQQTGFPRWQARAWFVNVKKRKQLLASAYNKLNAAVELIEKEHAGQKVMVFSETLESVRMLKNLLRARRIDSALIDSSTASYRRQKLLSEWGKRFHALLSVHTLEIGYDVPEARVEIILATTSNMNQIVQRIGRVIRKVQGKDSALIYLIYVSDTRDDNVLELVRKAIESSGGSEDEISGVQKFSALSSESSL
jgi:superfamily II DNA or RNA helicase